MGNCCSGEQSQPNGAAPNEVNMQRGADNKAAASAISSNRSHLAQYQYGNAPGSNYQNPLFNPSRKDILKKIVKLQGLFRGVLTRKWVQQIYGFSVKQRQDPNMIIYYQQPNYDN